MSIVVIGGGAIGLYVAGRLAHAGKAVALIARASGVAALTTGGLTLHEGDQTTHIPRIVAAESPEALPAEYQSPTLAIVCVKGYDTATTLPSLQALAAKQILTLQNGIGNEEALAAHFDSRTLLSGIITSSVTIDSSDTKGLHITITKAGGIGIATLGEQGPGLTRPAQWAELFSSAGLPTQSYADYRSLKWSKALLNMLGNGTAAALDMAPELVYADPRLFQVERRLIQEALVVMRKRGIKPINLPRYPAALLAYAVRFLPNIILQPVLKKAITGGRGGKVPSLLGDLQRGRSRSEAAYLYGAVATAAKEEGLPAPTNQGLWQLINALATGKQTRERFRHKPEALLAWLEQEGRTLPFEGFK